MNKGKKALIFLGVGLDLALTIFFFVISIIMIVKSTEKTFEDPRTLIGYLQANTTVYLVLFVIPLFLLLAANVVLLIVYLKVTNKKKVVEVSDLSQDELDSLKAELLNDLKGDNKPVEKEEKPAEKVEEK